MDLLFDDAFTYGRWGLALVALGMGAHLAAGTLNQAALARDRAGTAAACWLLTAALFAAFMVSPIIDDELAARGGRLRRRGGPALRAADRGLPGGVAGVAGGAPFGVRGAARRPGIG